MTDDALDAAIVKAWWGSYIGDSAITLWADCAARVRRLMINTQNAALEKANADLRDFERMKELIENMPTHIGDADPIHGGGFEYVLLKDLEDILDAHSLQEKHIP